MGSRSRPFLTPHNMVQHSDAIGPWLRTHTGFRQKYPQTVRWRKCREVGRLDSGKLLYLSNVLFIPIYKLGKITPTSEGDYENEGK